MFKHMLIPLDGSHLAETVLPAAAYLAQTLGASVTLLHAIERHAPRKIHNARHLTDAAEALVYLEEVARRAFPATLRVGWHAHTDEVNDVARSIVAHVEELRTDLIVLCTHGRGGLRDWLSGSLAQQVVALSTVPVLLIRPTEMGTASPFACHSLCVPLDGTPDHEQSLPVAVDLARACAATLHLIVVVPTLGTLSGERAAVGKLLPWSMTALLDLAQQGAEEYLRCQLLRLQAEGLSVTAEICRGEPTSTIISAARRVGADLIVLGTHGRTGMDAFWSGSVAPKVSSRSDLPLLLVPLHHSRAE